MLHEGFNYLKFVRFLELLGKLQLNPLSQAMLLTARISTREFAAGSLTLQTAEVKDKTISTQSAVSRINLGMARFKIH